MKTLVILAALLFAVTLSSAASVTSKAAADGKKHKAVMQFNEPVQVMGVMLKGEYLFVHDDAAMARGEACTFIYKGTSEVASKLVVSFHCTPEQRGKVNSFTVRTTQLSPNLMTLTDFQFEGETEAHVVPAGK